VFIGYATGAALMVGASIIAILFGVSAERKSLEALSGVEAEETRGK
jgi:hypothetical protein